MSKAKFKQKATKVSAAIPITRIVLDPAIFPAQGLSSFDNRVWVPEESAGLMLKKSKCEAKEAQLFLTLDDRKTPRKLQFLFRDGNIPLKERNIRTITLFKSNVLYQQKIKYEIESNEQQITALAQQYNVSRGEMINTLVDKTVEADLAQGIKEKEHANIAAAIESNLMVVIDASEDFFMRLAQDLFVCGSKYQCFAPQKQQHPLSANR